MMLGLLVSGFSFLMSWFGLVGLVVYFVPTIVALFRRAPNSLLVLVVNLFLGWSLIGWVVALLLAARSKRAN